eukprot:gnl/TRDRNA2_/TRDRNA2_171782_c6_seq1.p1 gnl/TRDRNA2_/TRDRNA2_171782_c6~~gnl/TRDRNA2_/TRDRNA2_171782_c6_seq1.p1  ORF type:complete len:142 (+),score=14.91 gnl/TRDRNA2_/TRDRNA2_171782_c6_seq1:1-426(+)
MLAIGHPLVCDSKYAKSHFPADRIWCPRNFLHTYHLGFSDVPAGSDLGDEEGSADCGCADSEAVDRSSQRQLVDVYCPLPPDLCSVLAKLTPAQQAEGSPLSTWLSRDVARLRLFAHCNDFVLPAAQRKSCRKKRCRSGSL